MATQESSPGYRWARQHALSTLETRPAWQFQEMLEQSQWYGTDRHLAHQFKHLNALVRHAAANAPYYQRTLAGLDLSRELTPDTWRELPIVRRRDLQVHGEELVARTYPSDHGKSFPISSSGSTGRPVTVLHNNLTATWHKALTFRSQLWAFSRFDRKLAVIRLQRSGKADYPGGSAADRWADEVSLPVATGPVVSLHVRTPVPDQVEWLLRHEPQVLVTFPSNLLGLSRYAEDNKVRLPRLKRILTVGEAHADDLRGAARRAFGAEIFDSYSAHEIGHIAVQCPENEFYHVQSESILVEVLDDTGGPCLPGDTGRVVLTPLHNYAVPLIRYEIGDYATVGGRCRCGRGLPVIRRVLGRQRNMMMLPDGSTFWPSFGAKRFKQVAPIAQAQFVQHSLSQLEARLVAERPVTAAEEDAIRSVIRSRLPAPMDIRFTYAEEIPRSPSGKYEDFVCLVEPAG